MTQFRMPQPQRRLTEVQVVEARRIIAVQASTAPKDGDLSPRGSLARHSHIRDATGKLIASPERPIGFPSQNERLLLAERIRREGFDY